MTQPTRAELIEQVSRIHGVLLNLQQFDQLEVRGVVKGLLSPTPRETAVTGLYYRTTANIETIVTLKNAQHFQAISTIARSLFELSVDMRLLGVVPDAADKLLTFPEVERLRAARNIIKFKNVNPSSTIDTQVYEQYVQADGTTIDQKKQTLWPNLKRVDHWSGMNLRERVGKLKSPFDEIYEVNYPRLSWQTHAGLAGVVNLATDVFIAISGDALGLAARSFEEVLRDVIHELKIHKAVAKIYDKLDLARTVAFTNGDRQARQLARELLG
jgi:hypothetical protein